MELRDCVLRIGVVRHGDEREAARFAGEFVLHEEDFGHGTDLCKIILEVRLGRVEREVAHVEFVTHV